jgi:Ca2+-binding RTX toxin-like protein
MSVVALSPAAAGDRPTCFGEEATIVADEVDGKVVGTAGNDVIVGVDGPFWIEGRGGNDRICVGGGEPQDPHTLYGGPGADRIHGGNGMAIIHGEGGRDQLYGGAGPDMMEGGKMGDLMYGGNGVDGLIGDGGHDVINGGGDDDRVMGHDGDDTMDGGAGLDTVAFTEQCCDYSYDSGGVVVDMRAGTASAADGDDTLGGFEVVLGSLGDDRILGSAREETIYGLDGNDVLRGRGGADLLHPDYMFDNPSGADDEVHGGKGVDTIDYGGYERVVVNLARGTGGGGEKGEDSIAAVENIVGSWRRDRLIGNAADNHILGEAPGGSADDFLDGRKGFDVLDGAPGTDECVNGEELVRCE